MDEILGSLGAEGSVGGTGESCFFFLMRDLRFYHVGLEGKWTVPNAGVGVVTLREDGVLAAETYDR
mgnify:CR=1 FL=1